MKSVLSLVAAVTFAASANATDNIDIAKFGPWQVSTNPPGLPPAGQAMPPGGYLAYTFGNTNLHQRISSSGDVVLMGTFLIGSRDCNEQKQLSLKELAIDRSRVTVEFQTQAKSVLACAKYDGVNAERERAFAKESYRSLPEVLAYFFGDVL